MPDIIHIACATDVNYLPHCAAMLRSLTTHMHDERLCVHIVHDGIGDADREQLESCVPIAEICWHFALPTNELANPQIAHVSSATYLRLQLDQLISPDVDRLLYLDVDMIISGSLRALWETDLGDKSIAAVPDPGIDPALFATRYHLPPGAYFNAGLLLIDMARIRAGRTFQKTLQIVTQQGTTLDYSDQDALNIVFWDDWQVLASTWNFQRFHLYAQPLYASEREMGGLPKVTHFTGSMKPWHRDDWHPYRWLYWRHLLGTPFIDRVRTKENVHTGTMARAWMKYWLRYVR